MTNTPSKKDQHPASASVPQKREWKEPVLEILSLEDAQGGPWQLFDGHGKHKSN
jgi:hypothetical protein